MDDNEFASAVRILHSRGALEKGSNRLGGGGSEHKPASGASEAGFMKQGISVTKRCCA